jgi:hypothetical protein
VIAWQMPKDARRNQQMVMTKRRAARERDVGNQLIRPPRHCEASKK